MGKNWSLKTQCLFTAVLMLLFVSSGCLTTRSYTVVKERPDQEITGNQGYLLGGPKEKNEREIKTRKTYVLEVELGKPVKVEKKTTAGNIAKEGDISSGAVIYEADKSEGEMGAGLPEKGAVKKVKTYIVQKGDTLEKISARPEIYGNKKKWFRIFKANEDKLKSPNKIYPGQVIKIPE